MQIRNFVGNKMSGGQVGHTAAEGNGELSNDDFVPLENIFALGDCCANTENPLPALAQVWASQTQNHSQAQCNWLCSHHCHCCPTESGMHEMFECVMWM